MVVVDNRTTDKADYYRQTLESERASRESADNQIIDLLHNVKSRYDSKLNAYMAKNKNKNKQASEASKNNSANNKASTTATSPTQEDSWSSCDKQSPSKNADDANDGWSTQPTTTAAGWGDSSPAKNKKNKDKDPWANEVDAGWATSDNNNDQQGNNDGWGTSTQEQNANETTSDNGDDDAQQDASTGNGWEASTNDWNTKTNTTTDGWACDTQTETKSKGKENKKDASKKESSPTKGGASENKSPAKADKQLDAEDWGCNNQDKNANANANDKNTKKQGKKGKNDQKNASPNNAEAKGASDNKPADKVDTAGDSKTNKSKSTTEDKTVDNKEFLEIKSQLWTLKLDLRLLERDKSKLTEEVSSLTQERDSLLKKIDLARQEHDSMKVRIRGLTVDLVSANEEIHKLNERIDEIEADKRSKEKESFMGESKRRAIENKYKEHQQQIANLESELNLLKEEKGDCLQRIADLERRSERLLSDLNHSKNLVRTLKDGCAMVEDQVKTYEVRHDSVVMSKADMERELIAIKEESSRHITTINKLQKSNEQLVSAFMMSSEAHDETKKELETLQKEYGKRLQAYKDENHRLSEANSQLTKLIDYLRAGRR